MSPISGIAGAEITSDGPAIVPPWMSVAVDPISQPRTHQSRGVSRRRLSPASPGQSGLGVSSVSEGRHLVALLVVLEPLQVALAGHLLRDGLVGRLPVGRLQLVFQHRLQHRHRTMSATSEYAS